MERRFPILVSLLAAGLVACTGAQGQPKATTPASQPKVAGGMADSANELCKCRTLDCIDTVSKQAPKELSKPQQVARHACLAKARVYAAASLLDQYIGLSQDVCACKTPECQAAIGKKVQATFKRGKSLEAAFESLQAAYDDQFNHAVQQFARCAGQKVPTFGGMEAARMTAFADRMCKCTDATCAQTTYKVMIAWVKEHLKGGKRKGTKHNVELWKKAQKRFNHCYIERMKAGAKRSAREARMAEFADRVCACADAACASATQKEMMAWLKASFKGGRDTASKAEVERWKKHQRRFHKCFIEKLELDSVKKKAAP